MPTEASVRYLNLPNSLSILRIVCAPVLVALLLSPTKALSAAAAVVFALVCATDWLDGYLARRWASVTVLGKFLDPLADKILITTALIMLIPAGRIPAWAVALLISREIAVTGLRAIASDAGVVIQASRLGKWKTFLQIIAIVPLIAHYTFMGLNFHLAGIALFVAAFVMTMWSGADYFISFFRKYRQPD
ncbi:MAG: CDP-diacylglycerol--glycerol-3-phosphate 3-phosphatidyltransferase [Deltaproteobacteria bacterium]|nr:CDP-diacylglycerol--glycerol-3-phosphate 3-phosphatidyltransferase [Deltaproteobacteria bacterium]